MPALTPERYALAHAAFEDRSTQRSVLADWLTTRLRRRSGRTAVLSVGCGDGRLDAEVAWIGTADAFVARRSYDVVVAVHSLYYAVDLPSVLIRLRAALRSAGELVMLPNETGRALLDFTAQAVLPEALRAQVLDHLISVRLPGRGLALDHPVDAWVVAA